MLMCPWVLNTQQDKYIANMHVAERMQDETWKRIDEAVGKLLTNDQYELTVLVLGSVGAGCSSTVNSLLAENVAEVRSSPSGVAQPATRIGARLLPLWL